jgi:hypothetical protein
VATCLPKGEGYTAVELRNVKQCAAGIVAGLQLNIIALHDHHVCVLTVEMIF